MQENNKKKGKNLFMIFVPFVITFLVQNMLSIFAMQIIVVKAFANYHGGTYTDFVTGIYTSTTEIWFIELILVGYSLICSVLFFYMYKRLKSKEGQFKITLSGVSKNYPLMIAGLLVVAIAAQYVSGYMIDAVGTMFPAWLEEYNSLLEGSGFGDDVTPLLLLYAIVLGPVCEELAFRGLTYRYAKSFMTPVLAIVSQAALFAAFHMNKLQGTFTFLVGLILGYVMYKYDNLFVVIILHILFNGLGTVVVSLLPSGGDTLISYFCWTLGSLIVLYGGMLMLKYAAPEVNNQIQSSDN